MTITDIARCTHAANKAYCESIGDKTQVDWSDAGEWQRRSAILGVQAHINSNLTMTPEASHIAWMQQKESEGWSYGRLKDPGLKQHPCMVPYSDLPDEQKVKDALFTAIVRAMAPGLREEQWRGTCG